jgi:hypothetical protein
LLRIKPNSRQASFTLGKKWKKYIVPEQSSRLIHQWQKEKLLIYDFSFNYFSSKNKGLLE